MILRDGSLQVLSEADRLAAGVYRGPADRLRGGQQPLQGRHDRPAGLGRLQVLLGRGRHAQVSRVTLCCVTRVLPPELSAARTRACSRRARGWAAATGSGTGATTTGRTTPATPTRRWAGRGEGPGHDQ